LGLRGVSWEEKDEFWIDSNACINYSILMESDVPSTDTCLHLMMMNSMLQLPHTSGTGSYLEGEEPSYLNSLKQSQMTAPTHVYEDALVPKTCLPDRRLP